MNKSHEVERVENLMYKGCEPHWHCTHCNNYWPFHCYGRKDLEQMDCPARKALKEQEPRVLTLEEEPIKVERHMEETEWNVCGNCGSHVIHKWAYCPYCGKRLKWDA